MMSLIMVCSLIGTVFLLGVCTPLSVAAIPNAPPKDDPPQVVIEAPFREGRNTNTNCEGNVSGESIEEDTIKGDLRKWIASSSVPILRARGMTDEEIRAELLRDFSLTEKQIDEILAAQ